jgi:hypothetical protein
MDALEDRSGRRLVRSDWVATFKCEPDPQAREELEALPEGFSTPGKLYVDYTL